MPKIPGKKYAADWKPPKSVKCVACGGTGKSSKGSRCLPCAGSGKPQSVTTYDGRGMK